MFSNGFGRLVGGALAIVALIALSTLAIVNFSSPTLSEADSQALVNQGQSTLGMNSLVLQIQPCTFGDDIGIDIRKNAEGDDSQTISSGGDATFQIVVTNCGALDLTSVVVTDDLVQACEGDLGALAAGASVSFSCVAQGVTAGFTNIAIATGTLGSRNPVEDQDPSTVVVQGDGTDVLESKLDSIEAKLDALEAKMDKMMEEPKCAKGQKINSLSFELTSVPGSAVGPFTIKAFDDNNEIASFSGVNVGEQFFPIVPAGGVKLFKKNDIKFTVIDEGDSNNQLTDDLKVHTSCSDSPVAGLPQDSKDGVTFTLVDFESVKK